MPTSRTGTARWKKLRARTIHDAGPEPACQHCGTVLDPHANKGEPRAIEIDHIVPVAVNPDLEFDPTNLAISCMDCNRRKGDGTNGTRRRGIQCPQHSMPKPCCPHSLSIRLPDSDQWPEP